MIELLGGYAIFFEHRKPVFDRCRGHTVCKLLAECLRQLIIIEHIGHALGRQHVFPLIAGAAGDQEGQT